MAKLNDEPLKKKKKKINSMTFDFHERNRRQVNLTKCDGRGRGRGPAKIIHPIVELDWRQVVLYIVLGIKKKY
jgi:hypothetical protein